VGGYDGGRWGKPHRRELKEARDGKVVVGTRDRKGQYRSNKKAERAVGEERKSRAVWEGG
jgi:hypothetical protein